MSDIPISDDIKHQQPSKQVSYQDIATKLLNDRLLLTALELHTELVESGKELRVLRDYFSNPGNFEVQAHETPSLICQCSSRSGSQVTLDSLDLTRFSEDGERSVDERVAVLEFELRKARETISALRNNLTVATESETSTPDKKTPRLQSGDVIKPHEQRALNFLINEYLLTHGYKLTSITFADENENQDFEDWDDVGLNISKPAELLSLYREGLKQTGHHCVSVLVQTEFSLKDEKSEKQIENLTIEIEKLSSKVLELNTKIIDLQNENVRLCHENEQLSNKKLDLTLDSLDVSQKHSLASSKNSSSDGNSPEHFEIIDKNTVPVRKQEGLILVDDNISNTSLNENEWTNLTLHQSELIEDGNGKKEKIHKEYQSKFDLTNCKSSRQLPHNFKKELLRLCTTDIICNAENQTFENATLETLVHILSRALLRIIPNIILNKREEVIPLLAGAVCLNPNGTERDKLLQQLFNLKKKPSQEERELILAGIINIARCSGENLVENEILPQCWEQLTHKHVERRFLVVESCIALIPYVSSPLRNSLILSMLQQMLEDREEKVREIVVRALSLVVALCDDLDKYWQCEELALRTLDDSSEIVVDTSTRVLFPVLAQWALSSDRLHTDLVKQLLFKLNKNLKDESQNKTDRVIRFINVIDNLLPFIAFYVASNEKILNNIEKDMAIELRSNILKLCTDLTNPSIFYTGEINTGMIFYEFDKYVADNSETWPQLDWFLDIVLPDLLNNLNHVEVTQHLLLQSIINFQLHICMVFGKNFTQTKIYPLYQTHIQNLEQILSSFNQYSPSLSIIPVYLVSILSCCDNTNELSSILKRFICALPLCGTPLDCLEVTVKGLCNLKMQELVVSCLWEGVVHQRPLVRASTAGLFATIVALCNENLLNTKVTPALVTLANDSDVLVRTATIPALGSLITDCSLQEVHDKAYMQLQMCLSEQSCRDNHTLLRQLVVTLGNIVNRCKASFRDEVILAQLSALAAFTSQMSNQTRKVDMALALLEAFSNVIYSPLNRQIISSVLLPGLRYLEVTVVENPSLSPHRDSVMSMIREAENRVNYGLVQPLTDRTSLSNSNSSSTLSQNVNQGVEDMKQRVSKIFQKPAGAKQNTLPNLQGIFKKK